MNTHLSSEQLDGALNGQPSMDAAQHLSGCMQCSGELASLRQTFGNFREAAVATAEHHRRFVSPATSRRVPRMAWGLAAAALFVSIAAPLAVHRHTPPVVGQVAPKASETMSDEALLDNVQNDLSASVPGALLPLSGTSTNSKNSTSDQRKN
jgi:hypothetical protein